MCYNAAVRNEKQGRSMDRTNAIRAGRLLPLALPVPICFLPLIVFDACYRKEPLPLLAAVPAFFVIRPQTSLLVLILIGCVLAAMLALALSWVLHLREELQQVRDDADSGTRQASLEKKELTAQQDAEIEAATLQERNRIAREIHDNVGHMLSRAILLTGALQTVNKNEELYEPLQKLNASLNDAMNSIRESVHDLYDDSLAPSSCCLKQQTRHSRSHSVSTQDRSTSACPPQRKTKYCMKQMLRSGMILSTCFRQDVSSDVPEETGRQGTGLRGLITEEGRKAGLRRLYSIRWVRT